MGVRWPVYYLIKDFWCLEFLLSWPLVEESSDIVSWLPREMTSSHKSPLPLLILSSSSLLVDADTGREFPLSPTPSDPTRKLTCTHSHDKNLVVIFCDFNCEMFHSLTWLGRRTELLLVDPRFSAISGVSVKLTAVSANLQGGRMWVKSDSHCMLLACVWRKASMNGKRSRPPTFSTPGDQDFINTCFRRLRNTPKFHWKTQCFELNF